jgi:Chromosome segregation ATPases
MNGLSSSLLPTGLWLFASALVVLVLLVAFGFHIYQRRRFLAGVDDFSNVADLAARKETLQADVAAVKEWLAEQRENLLQLTAEREEQEALRAELTRARQSLAEAREVRLTLTGQVEELEKQRQLLEHNLEELRWRIGDLEAKKEEAAALDRQLEKSRGQAAVMARETDELRNQSLALEKQIERYRQEMLPLKEETAKVTAMEARQTSLLAELHFLGAEVASREESLAALKKEAASLSGTLEEMRRDKAGLALTKTLEELRLDVEEARAIAAKLPDLKMEQAALVTRNQFLETQISNRNFELTPLKQNVSKLQTWLEQIQPKAAAESVKLNILRDEVAGLEARKAQLQLDEERLQAALENM